MDVFKNQKVKARKTKAIARRSKVQILSNLFFQAIEITVVVVTVAKLFHQLVITFENSGERFKGLAAVLASRHFVFVFGNVIAVALFVKSGKFRSQESDARTSGNGFYEEFVRESRREEQDPWPEVKNRGKQSITETEVQSEINTRQSTTEARQRQNKPESRGKQSTAESRGKQSAVENEGATETAEKHIPSEDRQRPDIVVNRAKQSKSYVRSRSANSESPKISGGRLRRSETETSDLNDRVTNDELRYKIESFIARQKRNQKDEEFCVT